MSLNSQSEHVALLEKQKFTRGAACPVPLYKHLFKLAIMGRKYMQLLPATNTHPTCFNSMMTLLFQVTTDAKQFVLTTSHLWKEGENRETVV